MARLIDDPAASEADLERIFADAERDGRVTSVDVEVAGRVTHETGDGDEPPRAAAPYEITYRSEAARRPITFSGTLQLSYSEDEERWRVAWNPSNMWPGIERAAGFRIEWRWPARAAIADRLGRKLAVGAAAERRYPFGSVAGSTVGHIERVTRKSLADAPPGRERGDLVGASGLEEAFEPVLAGRPGGRIFVVDAAGRNVMRVGSTRAVAGDTVRTTLDIRVQRAAEAAYGSTVGGAVVVRPATGDVLAVVSSAPFNPGNHVGSSDVAPFNRALSGLYPAGSAMKVVTAAAALETGVVKPSTPLSGPAEYRGVRNFESGDFGRIDFSAALKNSVNTAFAQVARRLGARRLTKFAEAFGFNRVSAMPLATARSSFPFPEDEGDLMWGAIGQAQMVTTPLQMATVAATIANRGVRMEPRIALDARPRGERVVSIATARTLTELMEDVVVGGTGQAARISGVRVAGKTGTAEVDVGGEIKNHAWFVCFAPSDDPGVAVAVVAELGGVGGKVAAPLARSILTSVLPRIR